MIELGKVQELVIIRTKEFGVYLAEKEGDEAAVLLPKKQVPEGAGIGDKVEVFIYKDSSDRLIATTGKPKLQVGETAKLEVKDVAKIGAFLDMGLEKDLLLPFKEQTHPVRKGEQCLVTLYVDKSRRLAATMRVYSHMSNQSPYKAEDWVTGTIYEINETIGAFVAVDHKYYGLIPKKELYGRFSSFLSTSFGIAPLIFKCFLAFLFCHIFYLSYRGKKKIYFFLILYYNKNAVLFTYIRRPNGQTHYLLYANLNHL